MSLLKLDKATIQFGGLIAVNQVSFSLNKGDLFGLIGPNGAGKTTCFNIITGVYKPTSGDIQFDGRSIAGTPSNRIASLGIARTFQNIRLFKALSVLEKVPVRVTSVEQLKGLPALGASLTSHVSAAGARGVAHQPLRGGALPIDSRRGPLDVAEPGERHEQSMSGRLGEARLGGQFGEAAALWMAGGRFEQAQCLGQGGGFHGRKCTTRRRRCLLHESNTFLEQPTTLDDFRRDILATGPAMQERLATAHHEAGGFFAGRAARRHPGCGARGDGERAGARRRRPRSAAAP